MKKKLQIILLVLTSFFLNKINAQSITVLNNSFEDQTFADGVFSTGTVTSWTKNGGTTGVFNPGIKFYSNTAISTGPIGDMDGQNAVFLAGNTVSSVSQILSETIVVGETYTLTVAVGNRDVGGKSGFAGYDIKLLAGGVEVANTNGELLTDATFTDVSLVYVAQSGDSGALEIQLGSSSLASTSTSVDFDNVRLTTTDIVVVEPPQEIVMNVTSPVNREIRQRNENNQANITFEGVYTGNATEIEIQATDLNGNNNTIPWTTLDNSLDGMYSGNLTLNTGWYQIDIRAKGEGSLESEKQTISFFGIGDVYITAGQSNAANWGASKQTANFNQISYLNTASLESWTHATDVPVSSSDNIGTRGSIWPILGDLLVNTDSDIPVAFACIARGASSVCEWEPTITSVCSKDSDNYPNLKALLDYFGVNGFKAILWHQGEKDRGNTKDNYVISLKNIINTSRIDAGWNIPWYVALASYQNGVHNQVIEAQTQIIDEMSYVFLGAKTDDLIDNDSETGLPWRRDGVHFTNEGLEEHANRWYNVLQLNQELVESEDLSIGKLDDSEFMINQDSNGNIKVNSDLLIESISLFDVKGKLVKKVNTSEINISSISKGIYFLYVQTDRYFGVKKIYITK